MENTRSKRELWEEMNRSKERALSNLQDKKYGMFIHYGLYSMLAGEWRGKKCEESRGPFLAEWIMSSMQIPRSEYSALAKTFDPCNFSAEAFVNLAKKAGMKYIMLTSKHHDGFGLFGSEHSKYTTKSASCGRDLVEELYRACKKGGVDFCLYYSHSIDWQDGGDGGNADYMTDPSRFFAVRAKNDWDAPLCSFDEYIAQKAIPQVKELVERYPDIKYIWYDVPAFMPEKYSFEFYKCVYDISPNILISHRVGNDFGDIFCPGDNKIIKDSESCTMAWETVGTMNNSWGFKHYDHDWKSPKEVLFWLVEIISKGGNYILNIGPDPTGAIPQENVEILSAIGDWIQDNSEAVYGTRRWRISSEGVENAEVDGTVWRAENGFVFDFNINQFWFTQKEDKIYCISQFKGEVSSITVKSLQDVEIKEVKLLSCDIPASFEKTKIGVKINFAKPFTSKLGFAVEIKVK